MLVRQGFTVLLGAEPGIEVVGQAVDGRDAVAKTAELIPDVVLMDIRMPVLDGIEATRQITGHADSATRVLILTTFDLDEYVYEALRAGASGFLLKDASAAELAHAIRVVAAVCTAIELEYRTPATVPASNPRFRLRSTYAITPLCSRCCLLASGLGRA